MERVDGQQRGTIVLATVKGDVHDIGKNLVDIILTNNGYKVVNLGIKQPIDAILTAAHEHKAHAIGMSGLLVKSTVVMRENLEEMSRQGLDVPVLLGGAALTRGYVDHDCAKSYACGRVAYARDAFDGLTLMDHVVSGTFDAFVQAERSRHASARARPERVLPDANAGFDTVVDRDAFRAKRQRMAVPVPQPPFWGARLVDYVPPETLVPYMNERSLYMQQWGFRKQGRSLDDYMQEARRELRPVVQRILTEAARDKALTPSAVYGFWPAAADGNDLVLFAPDDPKREIVRWHLPRQQRQAGDAEPGLCITDFIRDIDEAQRDVLGLQIVTMGTRASDVAREWFAANRYQDYVYLHGLGVELTEAMAEYIHKRVRSDLGIVGQDDPSYEKLLQQGYRGSRYSFGYAACPSLEDQQAILDLLRADRIGVTLTDEFMLHPEQSTSAIVVHHPAARYFTV